MAAWAVSWAVFYGTATSAQVVATRKPAAEEITRQDVQARLKQLDGATDLDEAARTKVRQAYEQAQAELDEAAKREQAAAQFAQTIRSAPQELRQSRARLAAVSAASPTVPPEGADRPQLEQTLTQHKDSLAKAKEALTRLEAEPKRRAGRRKEIPEELAAATARFEDAGRQLAALAEKNDPSPLAASQQTLLAARRTALRQVIAGLQQELAAYEATAELLPVQRDLAAEEISQTELAVKRWGDVLDRRLQEEATREAERARIEAAEAHPLLQPLAVQNRKLADKSAELVAQIKETSDQFQHTQAILDELKKQFTRTEEKVDAVGLTNAIGLLLRKQRAALPDVTDYQRLIRARQPLIRSVKLDLFEHEDRRSELATLDREVPRVLAGLESPPQDLCQQDLELAVRDLLKAQRDHLDALIRNYNSYFDLLIDLDNAQQQLIRQADDYHNYVGERVLWIRSTGVPGADTLRHAWAAILWLGHLQNWSTVGDALIAEARSDPLPVAIGGLLLVLLLYRQRPLRIRITQLGSLAEQGTFCRFVPTLNTVLLTALIAVLWPGVMWFVQWRLAVSLANGEFVRAVAEGLSRTAAVFLPLEFFRQVCRPRGLAEAHFGWPVGGLRVLRINLRWLLVLGLPLVFVTATCQAQSDERYENSLGRLAFIALALLVALFAHRVFRPDGDLFRYLLAERRNGWFYRFRHLWYALGTTAPLSLAVLATAGYFYTADQLAVRLRESTYVPLALAVLGAILSRWVLVIRRRLAIERARQRRAAAQTEGGPAGPESQIITLPVAAETEVDLSRVSTQIQRLIESFLVLVGFVLILLIWVDVLPALGFLDRVPLWPTTREVTESITAADGSVTVKTIERPDSITLADLMLTLLVLLMTAIAAHNIPGLTEIVLPRRLPIDAGARYAISTVSRYLVTILGLVLACVTLQVSWSKVQWLIAAVSVGLGFGLQEIFANFVSGLILLFERPIRIGDVVTVGEVTGVVSRIQIRATTITNWDRQDLIVPNKEFITGRVLNWTLGNQVNRIVIKLGVAYGTDTNQVRDLLLGIVKAHPTVMNDPAPMVTFEGFGASSLDFVIRAYLPSLDSRLEIIHQLHTAIDQAFRQHGIEMPFPQQDVHIRSAGVSGVSLPAA
jgi:potassium efflux system protein